MSMIPSNDPLQMFGENPSLLSKDVDWNETAEAHVFKADMSGLNDKEVKVEVEEGRVLQISGERTMQIEDKSDGMHRVACSTGKFTRSFTLPANARLDRVKASVENGVLTVTVPKEDMDDISN